MSDVTASNPTILVVDDSRLMRVAARKILKNDFEVLEAADGEAAWQTIQSGTSIDLVMSDLSMPNLDGLGLLKRIRESAHMDVQSLPVIIVTGAEDDDGSKNAAFAAGASDFITKPFESVQLLARAQAHAKQQRTQKALQASEATNKQLEEFSPLDTLTGLINQRAFHNHIEEKLSFAQRHGSGLALILLQVQKYKVLFLRCGKQTAEEILRHMAQLLTSGRRREDILARIGLDSFGILLPSSSPAGAHQVAENLHAAIQQHSFTVNGQPIPVAVSLAIAAPTRASQIRAIDLLDEAAAQLRLALEAGGNCIRPDPPSEVYSPQAEDATAVRPPPAEPADMPPVAIASGNDVQQAITALAHGRSVDTDPDALVRAVIPLLQAWNAAHGDSHAELITQIRSALGEPTLAGHDTAADSACRN
jgi:diguanylate cyclase (GGDEF)-like protein